MIKKKKKNHINYDFKTYLSFLWEFHVNTKTKVNVKTIIGGCQLIRYQNVITPLIIFSKHMRARQKRKKKPIKLGPIQGHEHRSCLF